MIYILENDNLRVKVSSLGAEMQSIRRVEDGTEYLWQGDPAFWRCFLYCNTNFARAQENF